MTGWARWAKRIVGCLLAISLESHWDCLVFTKSHEFTGSLWISMELLTESVPHVFHSQIFRRSTTWLIFQGPELLLRRKLTPTPFEASVRRGATVNEHFAYNFHHVPQKHHQTWIFLTWLSVEQTYWNSQSRDCGEKGQKNILLI